MSATSGPGPVSKAPASAEPAVLRAEIEQTRAALSETVGALAAKADVGARTHDKATELRSEVKAKAYAGVRDTREVAQDRYSRLAYRLGRFRERVSTTVGSRWPVLAVAGLAALFAGLTARRRG